ncbi:MAG: non-ribosomal peptide synthetase, partial [Niastella sp.]|uniref:non-ribosomal peptide synthetase n=1 Tax=Niastella sp. TaxID=1869183 RepID=UPI00389AE6E6
FTQEEGVLILFIEYNSDLFDRTTADRIGDHLVQLLESIIKDPSLPIRQLDYLQPAEKEQLLHAFNDTALDCSNNRTVIDLLEEQVSRTPSATALVVGEKRFSYREVNEWSNRLAAKIVEQGSVRRGDSVGVLLDRSEWSVFAMIGIMKLGCVYVPIDASLPASRIRYMLEASRSKLLITERSENNHYSFELPVITVDEVTAHINSSNPALGITGTETSYIIYTSGSTGDPKGVEQTHLTLYNLIIWSIEGAGFDTGTRQLQFSSFSFDMSLYDICYVFATGGELHVISEELRRDPWALKAYVIGAGITTLSMPYSALKALFSAIGSEEWTGHQLREIISAGEQLYVSGGLQELLKKDTELRLYNLYGPSETHVVTGVSYSYSKGPIPEKAGIGQPVYNTVIYILDKEMQLVPPGVEGEIYIGGWNLAKGYIGRADLTAEKFIPDPFRNGELVYRSGDIGKWLPGGGIEYLRRRDHQLKINGYRIELGEIEQALRRNDQVSEAIVVARTNAQGDRSLVAYIVGKSRLNSNKTRNYLRDLLPVYMLPDYYVQLEKLPLTPNGKVDKRALPDPEGLGMATGVEYIAPAGEIELKLEAIWSEVLGLEKGKISTGDNFFTLGGNSIRATRLVSKIRKEFDVMVALKDVFLEPSIAGLAIVIRALLWIKKGEAVEQKDPEIERLVF